MSRESKADGSIDRLPQRSESGSALILVLGLVAVLTVLIAHITMSSQILAGEASVLAERTHLKYVAESASAHAFWRHILDRQQFRNRNLDTGNESGSTDSDNSDRWRADGREHRLQYDNCEVIVRLLDFRSGVMLDPANPGDGLRRLLLAQNPDAAGEQEYQELDRFLDVLGDYVDQDARDVRRLHGKEQPEYAAEGFPDMPRNGALQFVEELLWIDGLREMLELAPQLVSIDELLAALRLEAAGERQRAGATANPSFYAAPFWLIQHLAQLTDAEAESVKAALVSSEESGNSLFSYLAPDLAARLRNRFSFAESGEVKVLATAVSADGAIRRETVLVRNANGFVKQRDLRTRVIENYDRFYP